MEADKSKVCSQQAGHPGKPRVEIQPEADAPRSKRAELIRKPPPSVQLERAIFPDEWAAGLTSKGTYIWGLCQACKMQSPHQAAWILKVYTETTYLGP